MFSFQFVCDGLALEFQFSLLKHCLSVCSLALFLVSVHGVSAVVRLISGGHAHL